MKHGLGILCITQLFINFNLQQSVCVLKYIE